MPTNWRAPISALLTCLALTVSVGVIAAPASAADPTTVKINEVETSGGTPGDWIELVNTGSSVADVSGLVVKDAEDDHSYVIPPSTTIAAGEFLVLDEAQFDFGLGGADSVRLFGADGTTVLDSYSWTTAAGTTYGRCTDGTGDFRSTATPTKGTANDCTITVKVNEVESNGGTPGDWIELLNTGSATVDLTGFIVNDNETADAYTFPSGSTLAAGAYAVIEESQLGAGLGGADSARLLWPDGTTVVDSYTWSAHAVGTTYGRCPNGTGSFVLTTSSTKGTANDCGGPAITTTVKVNEVESNGGTPGDWIELYNTGASSVDLTGYIVNDNETADAYTFPASSSIAAGGYLVVEEAQLGAGLGGADSAVLFAPDASTVVDSYSWSTHAVGTTYGRCPNGTGSFTTTLSSTKGAANDCSAPVTTGVKINEIESNGGTPGDWVELINTGSSTADISGYKIKDADDTHAFSVIPASTTITPGGFYIVEESALGFGLGTPDSVRLFAADGVTVVDSYSWTPHATTTYGRCPDGSGSFFTTTTSTKAAANDCSSPVRINEIESNDGTPGDWIELINNGAATIDLTGYVVNDSETSNAYTFPSGSSIASGAYLVVEEAQLGAGLGAGDSARLFGADGTTLLDSYTWTAHAATTYGRCANGTGAFAVTAASTKGAANACVGDVVTSPWPGGSTVATADGLNVLGGNMSGLYYEPSGTSATGVLWAVKNGPGTLFRLLWNGTNWAPDTANGWSAGKALHYPGGAGDLDAEGVTLTSAGSAGGVFVSTERNNADSGISRPEVLRFDVSGSATSLSAITEWNLTADLPSVAANSGLEAIAWIPDTFLVSNGFVDEHTSAAYNPANYANHGDGIFFVGLEANGAIYAYALNHSTGAYTKIATVMSGFTGVMDLEFEAETGAFWAVCDDTCNGRTETLGIDGSGKFAIEHVYERPSGMPNLNNEGFAIAPQELCVGGLKPVFWSDDSATDGFAIRSGSIDCTELPDGGDPDPGSTVNWTDTVIGDLYVGVPATGSITATGTGVEYTVQAGSLPAGVILNPDGTITGTPSAEGGYDVIIRATADGGEQAEHTFTGTVKGAGLALDLGFGVGDDISGAPVTIKAEGLGVGSEWSFQVFSTPITVASGVVGPAGLISQLVNLPAGLEPGVHHLQLNGVSPSGALLTGMAWFTLGANGKVLAISLTGPTPTLAELASTGVDGDYLDGGVLLGGLVLMLGVALVLLRRKTRKA